MWSPTQPACTGLSPTRCILFVICTYLVKSEESYRSKRIYVVVRQWNFPPVYKQRRLQPGDTMESFSNLIGRKNDQRITENFISQRIPKKQYNSLKKRTQSNRKFRKVKDCFYDNISTTQSQDVRLPVSSRKSAIFLLFAGAR